MHRDKDMDKDETNIYIVFLWEVYQLIDVILVIFIEFIIGTNRNEWPIIRLCASSNMMTEYLVRKGSVMASLSSYHPSET